MSGRKHRLKNLKGKKLDLPMGSDQPLGQWEGGEMSTGRGGGLKERSRQKPGFIKNAHNAIKGSEKRSLIPA